jgi:ribonuclease P protein component
LIWRIRDRATFEALRRDGVRARSGPIGITFVADPRRAEREPGPILEADPLPPRVAFAIGRRVGHAVERNRLRRRLRAVVAELARLDDGPLQPGAYLVGCQVGAVGLTYQELREHVSRALTRINRTVAR